MTGRAKAARPALTLIEGEGRGPAPPRDDEPGARAAIVLRYGELFLKGANCWQFIEAVDY